jgi:hypothetical protein
MVPSRSRAAKLRSRSEPAGRWRSKYAPADRNRSLAASPLPFGSEPVVHITSTTRSRDRACDSGRGLALVHPRVLGEQLVYDGAQSLWGFAVQ